MIPLVYIIVPSTKILRILKPRDGLRMTSIIIVRNAHIVVEEITLDECHRLHGFPPNYERRKFFVNNATVINKKENESETLTNQKEFQQSSSFSLTTEQYNSLLTLLQQSELATTLSTEHHYISNSSTYIICNLRSLPKSILWILNLGATNYINSSLVDVGSPTHPLTLRLLNLSVELYCLRVVR